MTHEGRMRRGEVNFNNGVHDADTEYFLTHKPVKEPVEEKVEKPGRKKK